MVMQPKALGWTRVTVPAAGVAMRPLTSRDCALAKTMSDSTNGTHGIPDGRGRLQPMRLNLLALALVAFLLQPAAPAEIRLIVKGDDMGAAHGINVGTIKAYKEGILRTTNVIVAGTVVPRGRETAAREPGTRRRRAPGTHERVGQRQVAAADARAVDRGCGRLLLPGGRRRGQAIRRSTSIKDAPWKIDEIERELRAQLDAAKKHLPQATYTWYHMGFTMLDPAVRDLAAKLTKEYGLVQADRRRLQVARAHLRGHRQRRRQGGQARGQARDARTGPVAADRPRVHERPGDAGDRSSRLRERRRRSQRERRDVDQSQGARGHHAPQHQAHQLPGTRRRSSPCPDMRRPCWSSCSWLAAVCCSANR